MRFFLRSHHVDGGLISVSRLDNNFKLSKGKGTLVSFGNTSGAVPPFSPLMLAENIKLLRPGVMSYMVTHCPKSFNVVSKGIAKINTFHKYPFAAKSVQQAQTDLSRGKPTGKSIVKIGD